MNQYQAFRQSTINRGHYRKFYPHIGEYLAKKFPGKRAQSIISATLMYGEIIGFYENQRFPIDEEGWFFLTTATAQRDTLMTRDMQDAGIEMLSDAGLLEHEIRGLPAKRYFRVNPEVDAAMNSGYLDAAPVVDSPASKIAANPQSSLRISRKLGCGLAATTNIVPTLEPIKTNAKARKRASRSSDLTPTEISRLRDMVGWLKKVCHMDAFDRSSGPRVAKCAKSLVLAGWTIDQLSGKLDDYLSANEWWADKVKPELIATTISGLAAQDWPVRLNLCDSSGEKIESQRWMQSGVDPSDPDQCDFWGCEINDERLLAKTQKQLKEMIERHGTTGGTGRLEGGDSAVKVESRLDSDSLRDGDIDDGACDFLCGETVEEWSE